MNPTAGGQTGKTPSKTPVPQESSMEREPATPDAIASEQQAKERSTRPGLVMLSGLLVAAAAFGTTLLTWVDARITGAFGEQSLAVSGSKAAPAVSALALVALAAPLAGRIAPRLLRYVVYGVAAAAGGWYRLERYCGDKQPCRSCGDRDQPPNRHNFSGRRVCAEPVAVGVGGVRCADYRGRAVGCVHLPHLGYRAQV